MSNERKIFTRSVAVQLYLADVATALGQQQWADNPDLIPDWVEIKKDISDTNSNISVTPKFEVFNILCPKSLRTAMISTIRTKAVNFVLEQRKNHIRRLLMNVRGEINYEGKTSGGEYLVATGVEFGITEINIYKDVIDVEILNPDQLMNQYLFDIGSQAEIISDKHFEGNEFEFWILKSLSAYRQSALKIFVPKFTLCDDEIRNELSSIDRDLVLTEIIRSLQRPNIKDSITEVHKDAFSSVFPDINLAEDISILIKAA
jgi:hypothetical protein